MNKTNKKGKSKPKKGSNNLNIRKTQSNKGIGKDSKKQPNFLKTELVPVSYSNSTKMKSPIIKHLEDGNISISNQELITEVKSAISDQSTNDFNLIVLHVNPGLAQIFPWLSSMARNYISYHFDLLELVYVPRNTVITLGSVMTFAEYDPSASRPENRIDFLNRKNAEEVQVFKLMAFAADQKDLNKEKTHYVRVAAPTTGQDIKLLDTCIFYFAYQGTTPNTVLGDLFWRYKINLITPTLHKGRNQITNIESTFALANPNTATTTLPFGTLVGNFVGDFASALLNTATGGLAGNIFTTGKTILKLITGYFPASTLGVAPNNVNMEVQVPKGNIDDLNGITLINEDDFDIMSSFTTHVLAGDIANYFTDISSTNVRLIIDALDSTTNTRLKSWVAAIPANSVFRFAVSGSSGNPSLGSPSINISDYDGKKTGLLNNSLQINYN